MRTIFFIEKELFSREGGFFSYRLVKTLQKIARHFSSVKMEDRPQILDFVFCLLKKPLRLRSPIPP